MYSVIEDGRGEKWIIRSRYHCAEVENWGFTEKHIVSAVSANITRLRDWEIELDDLLIKSEY